MTGNRNLTELASTLLQGHRSALEAARSASARARASADHAALLARHWRVADASRALAQARAAVADVHHDGDAQVRLALAEAVVAYYSSQRDERALPLIQQARQSADVFGDAELIAECEAWAGLITAGSGPNGAGAAISLLCEAAAMAAGRFAAAEARALYGLASLHHRCGLLAEALALYARAVPLARRAGDTQLLLVIHRFSALGQVDEARRLWVRGRLRDELCGELLAGLAGTDSLAQQLAHDELGAQATLSRAEVFCMMGRDHDALAIYEEHLGEDAARALGDEKLIAGCDRTLCLARSGQHETARASLDALVSELAPGLEPYTSASMASSLAAAALRLGDAGLHRQLEALAEAHWSHDACWRATLRAQLVSVAMP